MLKIKCDRLSFFFLQNISTTSKRVKIKRWRETGWKKAKDKHRAAAAAARKRRRFVVTKTNTAAAGWSFKPPFSLSLYIFKRTCSFFHLHSSKQSCSALLAVSSFRVSIKMAP